MDVNSLKQADYVPSYTRSNANDSEILLPGISGKLIKVMDHNNTEIKKIIYDDGKIHEATNEFNKNFFDKMLEEANKKLLGSDRQFRYSFHEKTNRILIRVIDTNTHEVLKEIPPEKNLDAIAKVMELVGLIFDKKI